MGLLRPHELDRLTVWCIVLGDMGRPLVPLLASLPPTPLPLPPLALADSDCRPPLALDPDIDDECRCSGPCGSEARFWRRCCFCAANWLRCDCAE